MRYLLPEELRDLNKEYQNAEAREERLIRLKLNEIVACYNEFGAEEREFADEITKKFCEIIGILKQQHTAECRAMLDKYEQAASIPWDPDYIQREEYNGRRLTDRIQYKDPEEMLNAFYNHYLDRKSTSTMKDYAARIKTFAYSEQYLQSMIETGELGDLCVTADPVLFTYDNIELILARFNTKDDAGQSVKQRLNIRSALRMLNEFKLSGNCRQ